MDLLLQKDLEHQEYAVSAVCNIFENVAIGVPSFYHMNPLISIKDSNIKANITELQKKVANIETSFMPAEDYLHIDVKMETGTGKTFVYTKTIYELHKRYGLNKFVIAVPTLPIKEGTKSFINDGYVKKFFSDTCGYDCEIELCTVDAAKKQKKGKRYFPSVVRDYVTGSDKTKNKIYVLLVNMALLTGSETSGLLTRSDYDSSVENYFNPLDAIGVTKPVVIIDEPHKFSRDQKAYAAIEQKLKPQCVIRYGATFPETVIGSGRNKIRKKDYCNLIYNLDAYASFEMGLIKGIAKEHFNPATKSEAKVKVLSIENKTAHVQYVTRDKTKTFDLKKNDSLSMIDSNFGNLTITGVAKDYVALSNGTDKRISDVLMVDAYASSYQEEMIRLAIKRHLETERINFNGDDPIKIKTLALFFIDDVYSYRNRKAEDTITPVLKAVFNKVLREEITGLLEDLSDAFEKEYKRYLEATLADLDACQAGYFAQDNNDSDENIKQEVNEILRDKKKLLAIYNQDGSFNTRRFLFSKWTLKEGWDNPNVFTIAKLRSSGSDISKLQEVGRGLRLPVNTIGSRVSNRNFELNYIVDFTEADFAADLVAEINGERGNTFKEVIDAQLDLIAKKRGSDRTKVFIELLGAGLVDTNKKVIEGKQSELLEKYPELNTSTVLYKIKDKNKKPEKEVVKVNKTSFEKIKNLWMLINKKYILQYDNEIDSLIKAALPEIIRQSLTDITITSVKTKVLTKDGEMEAVTDSTETHKIIRPMKYNEFLIRINRATNIPIVKLHEAIVTENKKEAIDRTLFNERTATNIVNKFLEWKIDNLKGHFTYVKTDIPVTKTMLTNSDGTVVDTITKLYIGSKDAEGTINQNYLYNSLAHDSDLELENIREKIDNVVVYGKIPRRSIAIPTIDGQTYSPDFMYLIKQKDGTQLLNLVIETKDYETESSLRDEEKFRISCAEAFFEALRNDGVNVTYKKQLKNDKMVSIIEDVLKKN